LFVSNARHVTAGGDVQNAKSGKRGQTNGQPVYWRDALIRWKPSKGSSAARDGYVTAYRVRNGDVIHLGDSERLRPGPHGRAARAFAIDDPWTDGDCSETVKLHTTRPTSLGLDGTVVTVSCETPHVGDHAKVGRDPDATLTLMSPLHGPGGVVESRQEMTAASGETTIRRILLLQPSDSRP